MKAKRTHLRTGMTLIEAAMCVLLIGVVLAASMQAAGLSATFQHRANQRAMARFLADGLMNEILTLSYAEPSGTPTFGRESGESSSSKLKYDDIDDFNGWTESPPQDRTGAAITDARDWQRRVEVQWVNPVNLAQAVAYETGCKRITVTVLRNNVTMTTRTAIRTNAP